jgi:hypothetical protein
MRQIMVFSKTYAMTTEHPHPNNEIGTLTHTIYESSLT